MQGPAHEADRRRAPNTQQQTSSAVSCGFDTAVRAVPSSFGQFRSALGSSEQFSGSIETA
eukprot:13152109-Alexandrium_andersonii.AAC.1